VIEDIARAAQRPVSRETFERLEAYVGLVTEENGRQNLVSASTMNNNWERHIADSAQRLRFQPLA
jgi:16S rRNA (guanine527-N7)-methyltransferase